MIRKTTPGIVFLSFAILWTWPLVTNLPGLLPGVGPGDNLMFYWNFWWARTALAQHLDLFHTAFMFAPAGAPLTLQTLTPLAALIGATALGSFPIAAALNITVIASLALNGLCAYLLSLRLCSDRGAAIVGGLVFGGSSYLTGHLQGHFNLTTAWTVPLFALATIEALAGRRLWAIAAGIVLGVTMYTDYYYVVLQSALAVVIVATTTHQWSLEFRGPGRGARELVRRIVAALVIIDLVVIAAIVTTGGFTLDVGGRTVSMRGLFNPLQLFWLLAMSWIWLRFGPRVARARREGAAGVISTVAVAITAFAVVALPVIVSAVGLIRSGDYVTQTYFWRSGPTGIDLATLVMGPPFHGLVGPSIRSGYASFGIDSIEAGAWLGIVPVVLTVLALRRSRASAIVRQWSVIGAVFFVWALGSHLYVLGSNTGMILPGAFLRYIPIVNNARIPGRAMVLVTLAVALLSAAGAARWRADGRRGTAAIAALALVFVLESIPSPFPVTMLGAPALYTTLRDRAEQGAVLELPLGMHDGFGGRGKKNELAMYFQSIHGRPIVGGYLARLPRSIAAAYAGDPLLDALLTMSEPGGAVPARPMPDTAAAAERLRVDGIAFVVLDRASAPAGLVEYVEKTMPLTLVAAEGERSLYVVR